MVKGVVIITKCKPWRLHMIKGVVIYLEVQVSCDIATSENC